MIFSNDMLIGNSFPWPLVRLPIRAVPLSLEEFQRKLRQKSGIRSFWGHPDTLPEVSRFCGVDLTPRDERAVLQLSSEGFPSFDGEVFPVCYVISPEYEFYFRPGHETERNPEIIGWKIIEISWENADK